MFNESDNLQPGLDMPLSDSWKQAIADVNKLKFPSDYSLFSLHNGVTGHTVNKNHHKVSYYKTNLPGVGGYHLEASYTVCEECPEKIVSQKFYLFNGETNTVYIRELVQKKRSY